MEISMMKWKRNIRNGQAIDESCEWCIRNVHGCQNGMKEGIKNRKEIMGNQMKAMRVK